MTIPLYTLLIAYLIGVVIFLIWTFFNVYHLFEFGLFDFTGKLNGFLFIGFISIVFLITGLLLKDVPWFDEVEIFKIFSTDELFNKGGEYFDSEL